MTHQTRQGPTPGPWRIVANTPSLIEAMVGDDYRNVGQALEIPREGMTQRSIINEMWANARFIAAAPRLAKALEGMIRYRREVGVNDQHVILLEARAALAEALGTTGEGEE